MVLTELVAACDLLDAALAGVDPAVVLAEDAATVVERLAASEKRCAAVRVAFALRAAECREHRLRGFSTAAGWLAHASGTSMADAERALDAGRRLSSTPKTAAAVAAGEVSLAQAHEICLAEAEVPGCEEDLLDTARSKRVGLHSLREEAKRRRLEAIDPEQLHARQVKGRRLRFWTDQWGMRHGEFVLAPEVGVVVEARVGREADRIYEAARRRAKTEGTEAEPWAASAADALVGLLDGRGATGPGRTELVLVCDIAAFQRGEAEEGELAQVVGGGPVPVRVIREMAVGAFIKAVLHDGVDIRTVAHFGTRYRPAHLQTALDLGPPPLFLGAACVDCGRRYGLQWDHIDPFAHGGPTAYCNLDPRCWPCHVDKTERDRAAGLLSPKPPPHGDTAVA